MAILVHNWRDLIKHAWSLRLIVIAALLSGAEIALPFLTEFLPIPHGVFAGLSFITVAAAFIARLLAQKSISGAKDE